jgi:ubiquinone/menaquinone biosynthesis C-methylase UbiE
MQSDHVFAGAVPDIYERFLGPVLFEPYAQELAARLGPEARRVLETAAGTGVVTRALLGSAEDRFVTATDLNQGMLDVAASRTAGGRVKFRQADAQALPFDDGMFDAVACGFGVMFMPDKALAFREARRLLRPGGRFVFSAWDRIEANPLMHLVEEAVAALYPNDPPRFLSRTPCGYHDGERIERDLRAAGFIDVRVETVARDGEVHRPADPATGMCQGSPLRGEIEARDPGGLARATEAGAAALQGRFGAGPFRAPMSAVIVTAA